MPRAHPEADLQRAVAQYLPLALKRGVMIRMVENKPRSRISGALQKARGVQAGFPDIWLAWYGEAGGAIELKSETGRQSPAQRAFQIEFEAIGGQYALCRSLEEVEAALREWKLLRKGARIA